MKNFFTWLTVIVSFALILIISIQSLLLTPGFLSGHDIYPHLTYSKIFLNALDEGQFPVRWFEWVWMGYSQPLFNFYQVGFYYFISLINLISSSFVFSFKISILLTWLFGGFFIFLLTKRLGLLPATLGSLIYTFSPYIILDIFQRSSYPELMVISLIPGILWSLERLIKTQKLYFSLTLSLFLGVALFSHLPSMVIFAPVISLYGLILLIQKGISTKGILYLFLSIILGMGLAAFYFLPAILELNLIQIKLLTSENFDFHIHFLDPKNIFSFIWGYSGDWESLKSPYSILLGLPEWIIIVFSFLYLILSIFYSKLRKLSLLVLFWLATCSYGIFMMSGVSLIIWENFKIIEFIQFPWRFFMIIPLSTAILSTILLKTLRIKYLQIFIILFTLLFVTLFINPYLTSYTFISTQNYELNYPEWRENQNTKEKAFLEKGYYPIGVENDHHENLEIFLAPKDLLVTPTNISSHLMLFRLRALNDTSLVINSHYFPGWRAYLDNQEIKITPTSKDYFMQVNIPFGEHSLELRFGDTLIRSLANKISIASIAVIGGLGLLIVFKRIKKI